MTGSWALSRIRIRNRDVTIKPADRRVLDAFAVQNPPPTPPTKTRTIYGGFEEQYLDHQDANYQIAMLYYYMSLAVKQFDIISDRVSVDYVWEDDPDYRRLLRVGALPDDLDEWQGYVRFVLLSDHEDLKAVVEELYYLSTTTARGVEEAVAAFGVTWHGKDVTAWYVEPSAASFRSQFEDRSAAAFASIPWPTFCDLPGPEQSAILAHFRLTRRIEWLQANSKK